MIKSCTQQWHHNMRENRMVHFASGLESFQAIPNNPKEEFDMAKFRTWRKDAPGADRLFNDLSNKKDNTVEDIKKFLAFREQQEKEDPEYALNDFEQEINNQLNLVHGTETKPEDRIEAEAKLNRLVDYINAHNEFKRNAEKTRGDFRKREELPPVTNGVVDITKRTISASVEGFKNSSGQEKVLMLAGLAASVLMLRALFARSGKTKTGQVLKNVAGVGIGLGVTYMAFEAVNKAVEKTRGAPLVSYEEGWFPEGPRSEEGFEEAKKNGQLEKALGELKESVSPEFLNQMGIEGKSLQYMVGVSNIGNMGVEDFGVMYTMYKDAKTIPDNAPGYPGSKSKSDFLTPVERFLLVEDVAVTLGLTDEEGNFLLPEDPVLAKKSMLYLMMDWNKE